MSSCVILGAGGHARETYWNVVQSSHQPFVDFLFVDDRNPVEHLCIDGRNFPVIRDWDFRKYTDLSFVAGVGDPQTKAMLVEKALSSGLKPSPTMIHRSAIIQDSSCVLGVGGVIGAGCILTTNVRLGNYVSLGARTVISHDSVLGDHVTACPGTLVAGNVTVADGVFLGIGSTVREKIRIAASVTVGAQACVIRDISQVGAVVAGVPAVSLKER